MSIKCVNIHKPFTEVAGKLLKGKLLEKPEKEKKKTPRKNSIAFGILYRNKTIGYFAKKFDLTPRLVGKMLTARCYELEVIRQRKWKDKNKT